MDKTQGCDIIFNYTKAGEDGSDEEIMNESDKMLETIALLMQNLNGTSYSKDAIVQKLSDAIYPALDSFATSETLKFKLNLQKVACNFLQSMMLWQASSTKILLTK